MAPAQPPLSQAIAATRFERAAVAVYSNTTGARYPDAQSAARALLDSHLLSSVEFVKELERDPETSDPEHQLSLAMRFDALLHGAAGNQVITGLIDTASIFGWALRLRAVRAMHDRPEVGLSRIREHREIVTALRTRDAERVETLMRQHLTTGIDYLLKQARQPAPSG